jgi:hypothetical protein
MKKPPRATPWLVVLINSLLVSGALAAERVFDFAQFPVGQMPPGFRSAICGDGNPGDWKIVNADVAPTIPVHSAQSPLVTRRPVLAQLAADPTDEHFPMLVFEEESYSDFTLTTRLMLVGGVKEQMAGIAFRIQDEKNYYVVRASALGRSLLFYKFVNGQRSKPVGSYFDIPQGVWHQLTLECKGNTVRCLFNGKEVIPPAIDYTFTQGKIAFWTKSDSLSYFSDTRIEYTPHDYLAKVLVRDFAKKYNKLLEIKMYAPASTNSQVIQIIASTDPGDLGKPAGQVELDVIKRSVDYSGTDEQKRIVTLPLHDVNGEVIAAVRVAWKKTFGQTDSGAVSRAAPILKEMEQRIRSAADLYQ